VGLCTPVLPVKSGGTSGHGPRFHVTALLIRKLCTKSVDQIYLGFQNTGCARFSWVIPGLMLLDQNVLKTPTKSQYGSVQVLVLISRPSYNKINSSVSFCRRDFARPFSERKLFGLSNFVRFLVICIIQFRQRAS